MVETKKFDPYQVVTDKIVSAIEKGVQPWSAPWVRMGLPRNVASDRRYNGINICLLWVELMERDGWEFPYFLTFKQALDLGGSVRKGEKGTQICFWKQLLVPDRDDETGESTKKIPLLRLYTVFNIAQCDGLDTLKARFKEEIPLDGKRKIARCEAFVAKLDASIVHRGDKAAYDFVRDSIQMPPFKRFRSKEGYYGTLFHELVHWTGAKDRCNRDLKPRFETQSYAMEELVAEIGASFLCAEMGIEATPREDHASYVKHWLDVLGQDEKAIFKAASEAQKAVEFLRSMQGEES